MSIATDSAYQYASTIFFIMLVVGTMSMTLHHLNGPRKGYEVSTISFIMRLISFFATVGMGIYYVNNHGKVEKWIESNVHINPIFGMVLAVIGIWLFFSILLGWALNGLIKSFSGK